MDGDEDETEDAAQGVGLISRRSNRRVGEDASRYPGRDGGDRGDSTALRRRLGYHSEEDDDDSSDDELPDVDLAALSPMERDEILVESAFRQIQRAQEKGRDDVQLTKEELGALERRRKRMEEEAARKAARRKARSQRISIPLSQLAPTSRKKSSAQDLSSVDDGDQVGYPPMGHFPPPPTSSRRRSGASTSTSANQDSRGTSPFSYGYTRPTTRQVSESSNARARASRARAPVEDSDEESSSASSSPDETPGPVDPFKYQVAGPRPTRAAAASRGNPVADSTYVPPARNAPPPPAPRGIMRGRRIVPEDSSEDSSESEESVVEVVQPPARRTRNSAAAIEEDRGRRKDKEEKEKAKKVASPAGKAARGSSTRKKKKR